jgi:hypothetical protein
MRNNEDPSRDNHHAESLASSIARKAHFEVNFVVGLYDVVRRETEDDPVELLMLDMLVDFDTNDPTATDSSELPAE